MAEFARLLLLFLIAAGGLTLLASAGAWWLRDHRRLDRALRRALGRPPSAVINVHGRAVGVDLEGGRIAAACDGGASGFVEPLERLVGMELIVDGQVCARAHRDEQRRALDQVSGEARDVRLRFVFDDPRDPDFEVRLWEPGDEARVGPAAAAIQEGRRWISRGEAILRQPAIRKERAPEVRERAQDPHPEDPDDDVFVDD